MELNEETLSVVAQPPNSAASVTLTLIPFDQKHYRELIATRGETIRQAVGELKPALQLTTAVDAGCAVGFFRRFCGSAG